MKRDTDRQQDVEQAEVRSVEHSFGTAPDYTDDYDSRISDREVLTVKEMAEDDQPRERARKYGIESLSNADLFAMILRTGTPGNPITSLCRELMQRHENLICNLNRTTVEQLMEIKGIGELKAYQILAVLELIKRYCREEVGDRLRFTQSNDIFMLMRHEIGNLPYEEMWAIFLNRGNRVIGKLRASVGGSAATVFDIKKILKSAILAHAESIVLCHNHPSGTRQPSGPDDTITRKFADACRQLEIHFLDHLIITSDGYYSYSDNGRL